MLQLYTVFPVLTFRHQTGLQIHGIVRQLSDVVWLGKLVHSQWWTKYTDQVLE